MRTSLFSLLVFCVCFVIPALAQQEPDPAAVAAARGIARHDAKLVPMLEQVRAKEWLAQGAPETYALQVDNARRQIQAIGIEMESVARRPEALQDCMKALFRVQAFHGGLDALLGGLRRYQNPALADLIQSVAAEDQSDIERLQSWVLQLADAKEQEFQVVEHEAQRCRADLTRSVPKKAGKP